MRALGADVILGNTYHLHFRPGEDVIEELGGLHAFSGWDGPILTDSGGFQVFSLRDTLLAVDDDGVTFRSVYDGAPERFTPESVGRDPARGSAPTSRCASTSARRPTRRVHEHEDAVRRTQLWAERQVDAPRAHGPAAVRDRAGRHRPRAARAARSRRSSRSRSTATRSAGSRSARAGPRCSTTVAWAAPAPARRAAALLHGPRRRRGDPRRDRARASTCSTASCRRGRRARARRSRRAGRLNLRNARFARDPRPLEEGCGCPACARFSRAFVRHLVNQQEILGLRLLSLHNLWFITRLTAGARDAIRRGTFDAYPRATRSPPRRRPRGGILATLILLAALFALLWVLHDPPAARKRQQKQQQLLGVRRARRRDPHGRRPLRDRAGARRRGRPDRRDRRRHPRADRPPGARDASSSPRRTRTDEDDDEDDDDDEDARRSEREDTWLTTTEEIVSEGACGGHCGARPPLT